MNTRLAIVLTTGLLMAGFVHSFVHARHGLVGPHHRMTHSYSQMTEWATRCGTEGCVTEMVSESK